MHKCINGTSYDELYEAFLLNCGYDFDELPQTEEMRYMMIRNAARVYNQQAKKYSGRMTGNIICNDITELLNVKLTSNEILIFAYMMAEILASTKLVEFSSLYSTFAKEMGMKDYKAQVDARRYTVERFKEKYTSIIEDEIDSFVMY